MKKIILMSLTVMILISCQKQVDSVSFKNLEVNEGFSKEKDNDKENEKKEKENKPFNIHGNLSGISMIVPSILCSETGLLNIGQGSGISTHFGTFTFDNSDCLGALHQTTFTYPNGEKTFTTETGEFINPLTGMPVQDAIFSGGTGRFKGATGTIRLYITKFEPTPNPGVYNVAGSFEGTVTLLHH